MFVMWIGIDVRVVRCVVVSKDQLVGVVLIVVGIPFLDDNRAPTARFSANSSNEPSKKRTRLAEWQSA